MQELLVGEQKDFTERDRKIVAFGDLEIGIFHLDGHFYAFKNECVHRGGPVCQGKILGRVEETLADDKTARGLKFSEDCVHIVCPWHGYEYDIRTGVNGANPCLRLKKYEVKLRDGGVYVTV